MYSGPSTLVQFLGNVAFREARLTPLVEEEWGDSFSLRGPGDVEVGILCEIGGEPWLTGDAIGEDHCYEARGERNVIAALQRYAETGSLQAVTTRPIEIDQSTAEDNEL